jgi:hypothetical protein
MDIKKPECLLAGLSTGPRQHLVERARACCGGLLGGAWGGLAQAAEAHAFWSLVRSGCDLPGSTRTYNGQSLLIYILFGLMVDKCSID